VSDQGDLFNRPRSVEEKLDVERRAAHHCHARGCRVPVPPEMLMCKRHWFMVPKPIRNRVWAAYRAGQCYFDPLPSAEWHEAADAAVRVVAEKERTKK
jgi:hypothetical protein